MREPIENEYFNWLCTKVLEPNARIYHHLLSILYQTEFFWVVPADEHRAAEGLELRQDFYREAIPFIKKDREWESLPCSLFEMLLAFAKRASFQTEHSVREWFWEMMSNLQLDQFRQVVDRDDEHIIKKIIHTLMNRTFDEHGYGGLFPMTRTDRDQRKLEIWYQFCEYLEDRGLA